MDAIGRGIIAGFLATLALAAVLEPFSRLFRTADVLPPASTWLILYLFAGLVWGAVFACARPWLRGPAWTRGIETSLLGWLLIMVVVMPFTRAGMFGLGLGLGAPLAMLAAHIAYGALLGAIFSALDPHDSDHDQRHDNGLHALPH